MAKKQGTVTKFPTKAQPSEAQVKGEFIVPADQQNAIRELDKNGADLQKALGALRLDFLAREADVLRRFQENRIAYEKTVKDSAKGGGLDFDKLQEPWDFNFDTMTFRRRAPRQEDTQSSLIAPPGGQK